MPFYIIFSYFLIICYSISKNVSLLLVRNCCDIISDILFMYDVIHYEVTFKKSKRTLYFEMVINT